MHLINELRLLAGVKIDPALEKTERVALNEAREVPNRKAVSPANEANLKKKLANCEKACQHMRNAVKALDAAPATDTDAKIPQLIQDVEDLCGELEDVCKSISKTKPLKEAKKADKDYDGDGEVESSEEEHKGSVKKAIEKKKKVEEGSAYAGCENEEESKAYSKGKKKFPGEEKCDGNKANKDCKDVSESYGEYEEERPEKFNTADDFKRGEKVLYDNGIWIVHVTDAEADLVGIIPPSMKSASKEEKAKAMQQVKRDKLRKPSEEECEVMAGPDGILGTADDGQTGMRESTLNYTKSNDVSHEDEEEDPTNVVGQGKGQWANSLNPEYVKDEFASQLDQRGDQSMDDYANKVKVPAKVKSGLQDAINAFEKDAEKFGRSGSDMETKQFYVDAADAFRQLLDHLNGGTIQDIKKAQLFATSLMGPMLHKIPDETWDFISNGGQKRSLKDYMNPVKKFPIEGPRNSE